MLEQAGWIVLGITVAYLACFGWGTTEAARAAGRSVWLFGQAHGTGRLAAFGFRLAFVLAIFGPLSWLIFPPLHKVDPFWTDGSHHVVGAAGAMLAATGAMLAFAAQMSMGASWRVGADHGESGALIRNGLFRLSRNPTFVGQGLLLAGMASAIPSVPTFVAFLLFIAAATVQVRAEERILLSAHGTEYRLWSAQVPRWIGLWRP